MPVWREELARIEQPMTGCGAVLQADDRQDVRLLVVVLADGVDDPLRQIAAVLQEPVEVGAELLERLDPAPLQPLDGEQRDQPDQRADAKLRHRSAVGIAEHVVEEAVLFVPELVIPRSPMCFMAAAT